jgi:hypothetical protein
MAKAARSEDHEMFLTIGIGAKHGQFVTRTNNEAFDMGIVESDSSQGRWDVVARDCMREFTYRGILFAPQARATQDLIL